MQKGVIEGCVLQIIYNNKEVYSSEIVIKMKENGFTNFSEGTLYPLLLRIEKEGYLLYRKEESKYGPSRKYYSLSEAGHKRLREFKNEWNHFCGIINDVLGGIGDE